MIEMDYRNEELLIERAIVFLFHQLSDYAGIMGDLDYETFFPYIIGVTSTMNVFHPKSDSLFAMDVA
jgi:hypothetical protein